MSNIDNSLNKFKKYLSDYEQLRNEDLSESDTRSKLIDRILIDVLGWVESDIEREKHLDSGYFDYKITLPGFHMIIEAKKQFVEFKLPVKHKKVSIKTLLKQNKAVIDQIRGYVTDSSVPNGVITNGEQFIIGKFMNTDGTDWKNNMCLIFDGVSEIESNFIDFYNNLSREAIIEYGGFKYNVAINDTPFQKIISTLIDKDAEIVRNNLSVKLTPIINSIFGAIFLDKVGDDEELIKECFVENLETKKNRDEIERLFEDAAPKLHEVNPTQNTHNLVSTISKELEEQSLSSKEIAPPAPIILVGSKGAGKTTFVNYLFKNRLNSDLLSKHPYVYIDFRKYYNPDNSFNGQLIAKDVLEEIYNTYPEMELHSLTVLKRVYYKEINRKDDNIWREYKNNDEKEYNKKLSAFLEESLKDNLSHLEILSKYLIRERRCRLIIIIDNADQFDFSTQEKVFLFANTLTFKGHCGLFISLREGYYYKWRNSAPFNAYESNVYHVTAPKYSEVLQKRINYTLKKIKAEEVNKNNSQDTDRVLIEDIILFLSSLKNSLFDESNSKLIDFLNYTTYPNIREGLRVFKLFLTSGYANVSEFIKREEYNPAIVHSSIPIQEFIKAIGLNNKLYYFQDISIIHNLFYPTNGSEDHFLKCRILKYLLNKLSEDGKSEKHEQYSILVDLFVSLGYESNIVQREIAELIKFEMIESDQIITDIDWKTLPNTEFNLSLTQKGYYYIKNLRNKFHYLDLVLQDTPIYNSVSFHKLKTRFPKANEEGKRFIVDRVITVKYFIEYLASQELLQSKEIISRFGSVVDEIYEQGLSEDIRRISTNNPTLNFDV